MSLTCSWCGPASLRSGAERKQECECALSLRGFNAYDVELYVKCKNKVCHAKFSYEPWPTSAYPHLPVFAVLVTLSEMRGYSGRGEACTCV